MLNLSAWLTEESIQTDLNASTSVAVLHELVGLALKRAPNLDPNVLVDSLSRRERLRSTAVLEGVAFPMAEVEELYEPIICIGCSRDGVHFGSLDDLPTQLFIVLLTPTSDSHTSLRIVARLTRLFQSNPKLTLRLLECSEPQRLLELFFQYETTI